MKLEELDELAQLALQVQPQTAYLQIQQTPERGPNHQKPLEGQRDYLVMSQ
jgi:hypothetical protein